MIEEEDDSQFVTTSLDKSEELKMMRVKFFDLAESDEDQVRIEFDFNSTDLELRRAILARLFPNQEVTPENLKLGSLPVLSGMQCLRGMRDILIDLVENADKAELEDTVIKERVKNAIDKER